MKKHNPHPGVALVAALFHENKQMDAFRLEWTLGLHSVVTIGALEMTKVFGAAIEEIHNA